MEYKFRGREAEYHREWRDKAKQDPEWVKHTRQVHRAYVARKRAEDPDWYERRKAAKRESHRRLHGKPPRIKKTPKEIKAQKREYYLRTRVLKPKKPRQTKEERRELDRKYYLKIKKEVIDAYGGICECCGKFHLSILSIDHIDSCRPEGKKKHGMNLYSWLKRNNFPEGFRVLCLNCNTAIGFYGYCPHKGIPDITLSSTSKYLRKIKLQAVEAYGSKCSSCGEKHIEFLQIDHINEDGKKHRASLKTNFYLWLKRNYYPPEFQCLCANCNWEKHINKKNNNV